MRLIDADILLKEFNDLEGSNDELNWMLNVVIPDVIQKQPTALDNIKLLERVNQEVENARRELHIIQRLDMPKEIRNKLSYEVDKILYNINMNIKEQLMIGGNI